VMHLLPTLTNGCAGQGGELLPVLRLAHALAL
jgi:hypothetical protein